MSNDNNNNEKTSQLLTQYEWMIRPCEMYKDEYNECTSIRGRFHQYFIFGESVDCSQWKRDTDNCFKYKENNDFNAAELVIKSEQKRRHERLKAHYSNNIWERRDSPPNEWNKPLPEYICKDYENSYLDHKAREMRGEKVPDSPFTDRNMCILM